LDAQSHLFYFPWKYLVCFCYEFVLKVTAYLMIWKNSARDLRFEQIHYIDEDIPN